MKPISVTVQVVTPATLDVSAPDSYDVVLSNAIDKLEVTAATDASGKATFTNVVPGTYSITASGTNLGFLLAGSVANKSLVTDGEVIEVTVAAAKTSTLVFKEIYYTGSKTPSGGSYFRDQFYEIYNNSEVTVYADGLCIGHLIPINATANMPTWDRADPDDYVYFYQIFRVPGSGNQYPVKPGESIIIAQMAQNHKTETLNPDSPVDLSSSEFEAYTPDGSSWIDNPSVINMPCVSNSVSAAPWQWLAPVFGPAVAIFFPDASTNFDDFTVQVGSSTKGKQVPVKQILDVFEAVQNEANTQLKRVPTVLDAGSVYASGTYVGEGFSRKILSTTEDGRNVYQDTNNSTNDFEKQTTPAIRRYDAKIPSWNTWAK
ncbi:MAG: DUF4876 domain-containing protein [Tannerella sp.]|nr:DUF4876 domain-containing protein [Tannerella sp.]